MSETSDISAGPATSTLEHDATAAPAVPVSRAALLPRPRGRFLKHSEPVRSLSRSGSRRAAEAEPKFVSWRVLRYPDFRRYFLTSTFSNAGNWLQNTAQAMLAYHLTHSVWAVGVVVSAQFAPVLLFGPWVGPIVARSRSLIRLLVITQIASAVTAGTLGLAYATGHLGEVRLAIGAFIIGLAYCIALPGFSVLVPSLVPSQRQVRAALAMNSTSYNLGRALAPLFAVLIVTTVGYDVAFALNGVSFLILVAGLCTLKARPSQPPERSRVRDGFAIARRNRSIWLLLAMVTAVTIAADPVLVLGPAMAHYLGASSGWAGCFLACLGAGSVIGSFLPLGQPQRLRSAVYPLLLLGVAIIVFSLGIDLAACLAAAFLAGVACLLTGSMTQALLVREAGTQRAAVMALWAVAWAGSKPLASLTDGLLASHLGIHVTGILLALPAVIPGLLVLIFPERMWQKAPKVSSATT